MNPFLKIQPKTSREHKAAQLRGIWLLAGLIIVAFIMAVTAGRLPKHGLLLASMALGLSLFAAVSFGLLVSNRDFLLSANETDAFLSGIDSVDLRIRGRGLDLARAQGGRIWASQKNELQQLAKSINEQIVDFTSEQRQLRAPQ